MARNQEKAQTMLARWLRYREEEGKGPQERRPYLAQLCDDLHKAEKWRRQIIKEISKNVTEIQNASLGEHRIRDLNDRINKLLREKRHWERRIKELGGMDYRKHSGRGIEGMSVGGQGGYLYFGAAKDLPGVRELLEVNRDDDNRHKRSRKEMYDSINADYYGFGDDDDGELFWREKQQESKARLNKVRKWENKTGKTAPPLDDSSSTQATTSTASAAAASSAMSIESDASLHRPWKRQRTTTHKSVFLHSHIPTQSEIDAILLEKRKQMLLAKFTDASSSDAQQLAIKLNLDAMMTQKQSADDDDSAQPNETDQKTQPTTVEADTSAPATDAATTSTSDPNKDENTDNDKDNNTADDP